MQEIDYTLKTTNNISYIYRLVLTDVQFIFIETLKISMKRYLQICPFSFGKKISLIFLCLPFSRDFRIFFCKYFTNILLCVLSPNLKKQNKQKTRQFKKQLLHTFKTREARLFRGVNYILIRKREEKICWWVFFTKGTFAHAMVFYALIYNSCFCQPSHEGPLVYRVPF